ncbi:hypothetical protein D3C87_1569970 [compost metagenome]
MFAQGKANNSATSPTGAHSSNKSFVATIARRLLLPRALEPKVENKPSLRFEKFAACFSLRISQDSSQSPQEYESPLNANLHKSQTTNRPGEF